MQVSKQAIELIKRFEGFKSNCYVCPGGYKTIGYGHIVNDNEFIEEIDEKKGEMLLSIDIEQSRKSVLKFISAELTQGQFDALISFTFNLGGGALQRSGLRRKINRGEHEEVPREFMRWIHAGGVKLSGLIRRREAEVELYLA